MSPAPPVLLLKYLGKAGGTNYNFLGTIRTNLKQLAQKFSRLKSKWEGPGTWTYDTLGVLQQRGGFTGLRNKFLICF